MLMRGVDVDRIRSERQLSMAQFKDQYNAGLPAEFPRVSLSILRSFRSANPGLFAKEETWSLGQHRKRVMDWLPAFTRNLELAERD